MASSPSAGLLCLLLLYHGLTRPSQFSQFDLGVLGSVQRHLAVLPGRVGGALVRLACGHLQTSEHSFPVVRGNLWEVRGAGVVVGAPASRRWFKSQLGDVYMFSLCTHGLPPVSLKPKLHG